MALFSTAVATYFYPFRNGSLVQYTKVGSSNPTWDLVNSPFSQNLDFLKDFSKKFAKTLYFSKTSDDIYTRTVDFIANQQLVARYSDIDDMELK